MNNNAKVNIKITLVALVLFVIVASPRVMAQSIERVFDAGPYSAYALLFWLGGNLTRTLRRGFEGCKRAFDIFVALLALVVMSPVVLVCMGFIKLISPVGKVVYTQKRVGKNGAVFSIYKLRSMRPDAERLTGAVWSHGEKDPRVIPFIGRFIRSSHIDEIPQFINVLMGDMSVVGPRPERPEIVAELMSQVPEYGKRLQVRPGITGLAQIRNHYDVTLRDVKKKVKLDLLYIRKVCFWSELSILLRTFIVVARGKVIS